MEKPNIAIIGLGRIGSAFLKEMLKKSAKGITLEFAAEQNETPGKEMAKKAGLKLVTLDEVVQLGEKIDVIFELTGLPEVRKELREKLITSKNNHTVIASESIVRTIWALISDETLPVIAGRKTGY